MWQSDLFDWIIVEADGAAQKSLKACAPHEPVIPMDTRYLIILAGLDAIGKKLDDQTVHRADIFSKNTGLPLGEIIDESSLAGSLTFEIEQLKRSKELNSSALKIAFLNKADHRDAEKKGKRVAELLMDMENCLFSRVVVGSLQADSSIIEYYDEKKAENRMKTTK